VKKTRRKILPRADINVTPFIDILLVLLVIDAAKGAGADQLGLMTQHVGAANR
jgi:biopolymer transport protein ExbD